MNALYDSDEYDDEEDDYDDLDCTQCYNQKKRKGSCETINYNIVVLTPQERASRIKWGWRYTRAAVKMATEEATELLLADPNLGEFFKKGVITINVDQRDISTTGKDGILTAFSESSHACTYQLVQMFQDMNIKIQNATRDVAIGAKKCTEQHTLAAVVGPVTSNAARDISELLTYYKRLSISPGFLAENFQRDKPTDFNHVVRTGPTGNGMARMILRICERFGWNTTRGFTKFQTQELGRSSESQAGKFTRGDLGFTLGFRDQKG